MADRIADPRGERTPYGPGQRWPERVDVGLADGLTEGDVDRWVQSASILHSNGDAMDIAVQGGRIVGVRGRAVDRVNHGRLDPKDLYGWQANNSPDRLTRPLVRQDGRLVETDWDTAMGRIVERSRQLLDGPGGWGHVGFYTTGQLFLEEYYALAVIGKASIGTQHLVPGDAYQTALAADLLVAVPALRVRLNVRPRGDRVTEPPLGLPVHLDEYAAAVRITHPGRRVRVPGERRAAGAAARLVLRPVRADARVVDLLLPRDDAVLDVHLPRARPGQFTPCVKRTTLSYDQRSR